MFAEVPAAIHERGGAHPVHTTVCTAQDRISGFGSDLSNVGKLAQSHFFSSRIIAGHPPLFPVATQTSFDAQISPDLVICNRPCARFDGRNRYREYR